MTGPMAYTNPIRYRGYYYDDETGWYWLQTRYYNPTWCRFINADCLFIAGKDALNGSNMYTYCGGNPVMYTDPNGMAAQLSMISLFFLSLDYMFNIFSMFGMPSNNTFLLMAVRFMDKDVMIMAAVIFGEIGEDTGPRKSSYDERLAVAWTMMNQLAGRNDCDTVRSIFENYPNAYQAYNKQGYWQALDYYSGNSTKVESSYRSCLLAAIDAYFWRKNDPTDGAVRHNGSKLNDPAYILTIDKDQRGWQNNFYKLAPGYKL